jgi:hypothetical protein
LISRIYYCNFVSIYTYIILLSIRQRILLLQIKNKQNNFQSVYQPYEIEINNISHGTYILLKSVSKSNEGTQGAKVVHDGACINNKTLLIIHFTGEASCVILVYFRIGCRIQVCHIEHFFFFYHHILLYKRPLKTI